MAIGEDPPVIIGVVFAIAILAFGIGLPAAVIWASYNIHAIQEEQEGAKDE